MSTPITGIVEAIITKPSGFVDVQVNGQKYNNGKYPPRGVKQGDTVSFEYDTQQRGQYTNHNIVPRTLRIAEGAAPSPAAGGGTPAPMANVAAAQGGGGRGPYVPFDERQEIISKQAALNTAQSFVEFAAANGGVAPLPKAAKDGERLTLLRGWWLDEAAKVYKLTTGRDWTMPEQDAAASPGDRRSTRKTKPAETSADDTGSNEFSDEFADDDIPF